MRILVAVVLSLALLFGGLVSTTLFVGGAGTATAAACGPTGATLPAGAAPPGSSPAPASGSDEPVPGWDADQVAIAAAIIAAATERGLNARAQAIGVMTGIGESTLRNLDRGDAVGPDSRGVFQQRDNGAWGTYEQRMTPQLAAGTFYDRLLEVPDWQNLSPTLAAHAVQRNADPQHYARFWNDAVILVAAITGNPTLAATLPRAGDLTCAPGALDQLTGNGPASGGTWPGEGCTAPDPTGGRCLTPRTATLATQLLAASVPVACQADRPWAPNSDHNTGKACDITYGSLGAYAAGADRAAGDQMATQLQAAADTLGVAYLIWYGRIWHSDRADEGWRPYNGGGTYDPTAATGGHFDHIHISMR
ncbi:hypothetical protein [Jannaschia sp. R86511]|uniref:hypothetical protein n=1 Tax=Jannaschia sp. R86511 TaxID=3093853 RepID=UPI0036D38E08